MSTFRSSYFLLEKADQIFCMVTCFPGKNIKLDSINILSTIMSDCYLILRERTLKNHHDIYVRVSLTLHLVHIIMALII